MNIRHLLFASAMLASNATAANATMNACPTVYPECFPVSINDFETAHMLLDIQPLREWERNAINIFSNETKGIVDLIDTDCGAMGLFHLQPVDPLDLGWTTNNDCPIEDEQWREKAEQALYSPYSAALQLHAWRSTIGRSVRYAERQRELTTEEKTIIACIANSLGAYGMMQLGDQYEWEIKAILCAYIKQHPTLHRIRRANTLMELL